MSCLGFVIITCGDTHYLFEVKGLFLTFLASIIRTAAATAKRIGKFEQLHSGASWSFFRFLVVVVVVVGLCVCPYLEPICVELEGFLSDCMKLEESCERKYD